MFMTKETSKEIEGQIRNDYRNGDYSCKKCGKELSLEELEHGYCVNCYEDIEKFDIRSEEQFQKEEKQEKKLDKKKVEIAQSVVKTIKNMFP